MAEQDLIPIRKRLANSAGSTGDVGWRSLREVLRAPTLPEGWALDRSDIGLSRRTFLEIVGLATASAAAASCARTPPRAILPYTVQPPSAQPGQPVFYATSILDDGFAVGLL